MNEDLSNRTGSRANQAIAQSKRELQRTLNQGEDLVASSTAHIHRAIDQLRTVSSR